MVVDDQPFYDFAEDYYRFVETKSKSTSTFCVSGQGNTISPISVSICVCLTYRQDIWHGKVPG